jgi:tetratricopeptide (TPR) repeat protein
VEIAIDGGNRFGEAGNGCLFGMVYLGLGEWENAISVLESARAVSRSYDVRDWLGIIAMRLGYAYVRTGRVDEGLALMQEGAAHCEAIDQMTNYPDRLATLGECYLVAGQRADAEATARRALEMAIKQRRPVDEARCRFVLGVILGAADTPDISPAVTCFEQSRALAASLEMRPLVAHCHRELGLRYGRVGRRDAAREEVAAARQLYAEMEMSTWLGRLEAETMALALPV